MALFTKRLASLGGRAAVGPFLCRPFSGNLYGGTGSYGAGVVIGNALGVVFVVIGLYFNRVGPEENDSISGDFNGLGQRTTDRGSKCLERRSTRDSDRR